MKLIKGPLLLMASFWIIGYRSSAQDSAYIRHWPQDLLLRTYTKIKTMRFQGSAVGPLASDFKYLSNSTFNQGIGFTYGKLNVNTSIPLFLYRRGFGDSTKTKKSDWQFMFMSKKSIVDFGYMQYKRVYLVDAHNRPIANRPDYVWQSYHVLFEHAFNWQRFSFAAVAAQLYEQRRSAGSLLAGVDLRYQFWQRSRQPIDSPQGRSPVTEHRLVGVSPSLGYGYIWVPHPRIHLAALASAVAGIQYGHSLTDAEPQRGIKLLPALMARAALGYNDKVWSLGLLYTYRITRSADDWHTYTWNESMGRLIFTYRLTSSAGFKKWMKPFASDHP